MLEQSKKSKGAKKAPPSRKKKLSRQVKSVVINSPQINPRLLTYLKLDLNFSNNLSSLEEVFILQFIIFSCLSNEKRRYNRMHGKNNYWINFSIRSFCSEYLFMSKDKLSSALKRLENNELIIADIISKGRYLSRSKWYRPNYETLSKLGYNKKHFAEFYGAKYLKNTQLYNEFSEDD